MSVAAPTPGPGASQGRRLPGLAPGLTAALLLGALPASAHEVGLSRGDYLVEGAALRVDVIFARKELSALVATLDADHDGALTQPEVDAARDALQGALVGRIKVTGDGAACAGTLDRAELTEQDGLAVRALYRCARRPREVSVALTLLEDVPFGHRHLVRAHAAAGPLDLVLSQRTPSFSFTAPPAPPASTEPSAPSSARGDVAASPLRRGVLHVAAAWELPVFLAGLLARCSGRRPAALAAAAFAASLGLGLVLSALGAFTPSPTVLAAAIALSLAYVGIDNLAQPAERRPWIAVPFGLVHGLGCGAAFRALGAPAGSLGSYMFGVAAALGIVLAALLPAVAWLRAQPGSRPRGVAALSALVAAAGLIGLGLRLY